MKACSMEFEDVMRRESWVWQLDCWGNSRRLLLAREHLCSEHTLLYVWAGWVVSVQTISGQVIPVLLRVGSCWDLMSGFHNWRAFCWPNDILIHLLFGGAYLHMIPFSFPHIKYFSLQVLYFKHVISLWIGLLLRERTLRSACCVVSRAFAPAALSG